MARSSKSEHDQRILCPRGGSFQRLVNDKQTLVAVILGNAPAMASEDGLPARDAVEVKQLAAGTGVPTENGGNNQTFINVFQIARAEAIGINRNNGMKMCKAYFTCDLNNAKALDEKSLMA